MSCRNPLSSNRMFRWPLGLGLLAASAGSTALAADLIVHNGFEACWSTAITKAQFLGLLKSTVDATTACMPEFPYTDVDSGFVYHTCNTAACPSNQTGCPVALNAGTFGGNFATGIFSAPGSSTDNISIPVSYSDGATSGTCTITFTNIAFALQTPFSIRPDGNNGDYMAGFAIATPDFGGLHVSAPDVMCSTLFGLYGMDLVQTAEYVATTDLTTAFDSNVAGKSVCPLTP